MAKLVPRSSERIDQPQDGSEPALNAFAWSVFTEQKPVNNIIKVNRAGSALAGDGTASGGYATLNVPSFGAIYTVVFSGIAYSAPAAATSVIGDTFSGTEGSIPFTVHQSMDEGTANNSAKWALGLFGQNAATYGFVSIPAPETGAPFTLAVGINTTIAGYAAITCAYVNGIKQTLTGGLNTRPGGEPNTNVQSVRVLHRAASLYANVGCNVLGYLKGNAESQVKSYSLNPWQLFEYELINLYLASAGAGSVGSSDGVATVSGVGSSTAASPGSSAGIAAVSGVGASTTRGVGASDGVAAVSGIGSATGSATGTSNGIAAVSGTGISTAAATGASAGVATVDGIAPLASDTGVGSSSGAAVASGVGASTVAAVGSSVGLATVDGISPVISAESANNWQEYPKDFLWSRKELEPEEVEIIEALAETQAEDLKSTEEERKDQLRKALKLKNIALELKHIEAMNALREQAINAEIAAFMKITQIEAENDAYLELVLLATAA